MIQAATLAALVFLVWEIAGLRESAETLAASAEYGLRQRMAEVSNMGNPTVIVGGNPKPAVKRWLTGSEAAARAGVHPDTMYRILGEGRVPGATKGENGRWSVPAGFEILPAGE